MIYYVNVKGCDKVVCKKSYLSIHGIYNGRLSRALEKKKKTSNAGAGKERAGGEKALHLARANKAIDMLRTGTLHAKNDETIVVACFDLQQALPKCLPNTVQHLVLYSDSCVGHNENFTVITFLISLIHNDHFDTIRHQFLVSGHTYMPCDRDFGLHEAEKIKRQYVYTPEDWIDVIRKSRRRNPFNVYKMNGSDFLSFECLTDKLQKRVPMVVLPKQQLRIRCWLESRCRRNMYINDVAINLAKIRDLISLLCYVPPVHHAYYNSLVSKQSKSYLPEEDSEDDIMDYTD
ncbi:hypothetical protein PR048_000670 [Dryococelus australis]|uniref:DUF7869 domain-containing protein n=1 Tax=Dryococelus australis TaxID=614101 RepID=A0ABQ9IF95_9NEOP|nr:hypothetical protein PR048_000670 [Dryococelus australis]